MTTRSIQVTVYIDDFLKPTHDGSILDHHKTINGAFGIFGTIRDATNCHLLGDPIRSLDNEIRGSFRVPEDRVDAFVTIVNYFGFANAEV